MKKLFISVDKRELDPTPDGYKRFEPGLKHYFVDDVEVSEDEFRQAESEAQAAS